MRAFVVACLIAVCLMLFVASTSPDRSTDAQTETVLAEVECPCSLTDCAHARVALNYMQPADAEVESGVLKLPMEPAGSESEYATIDQPHPIDQHGETVGKRDGTVLKLPHYGMNSSGDGVEAADTKGQFRVGVRS